MNVADAKGLNSFLKKCLRQKAGSVAGADLASFLPNYDHREAQLSRLIFTAQGGNGVPVYSPKDGILNAQFTVHEINNTSTSLLHFLMTKLMETDSYSSWMHFNTWP